MSDIKAMDILTVLCAIGTTVRVVASEHCTCHTMVVLSNGWALRIFDECEGAFDYLEAVIIEGYVIELWEAPIYTDDPASPWWPIINWEPKPYQLDLMNLT